MNPKHSLEEVPPKHLTFGVISPALLLLLTFVSLVCCVGLAAVRGLTGSGLRTEKWKSRIVVGQSPTPSLLPPPPPPAAADRKANHQSHPLLKRPHFYWREKNKTKIGNIGHYPAIW